MAEISELNTALDSSCLTIIVDISRYDELAEDFKKLVDHEGVNFPAVV